MFSFTKKRIILSLSLTFALSSVLFLLHAVPTANADSSRWCFTGAMTPQCFSSQAACGAKSPNCHQETSTITQTTVPTNNLGTAPQTAGIFDCGLSGEGLLNCVLEVEYAFLVSIPHMLVKLASYIFDSMWAFGLSSATYNQGDFVNTGWVVCRDLANTFFIFVLLYIAIGTILQLSGVSTKQLLSTLIVVALLINFSMYITRFVVDMGNIFALEFYSTFPVDPSPPIKIDGIQAHKVGEGFMNALLDPLTNIIQNIPTKGTFGLKAYTIALVGIEMLIVAFIFLVSGFLLMGRVVAIWIIMIVSPLAFFSFILPKLKGAIWSKWVSNLTDQAFFPAIFLFFIY
jgi:hypothetical protein